MKKGSFSPTLSKPVELTSAVILWKRDHCAELFTQWMDFSTKIWWSYQMQFSVFYLILILFCNQFKLLPLLYTCVWIVKKNNKCFRFMYVVDVYKRIPGTPAYWKLFRNEIFARMEQLGPFQFFFTLSSAEMHWPEVATSILHTIRKKNSLWRWLGGRSK